MPRRRGLSRRSPVGQAQPQRQPQPRAAATTAPGRCASPSGSPEASAHVQVQRKYGWELSDRVCGARGAAAHACAPGLSTGRRLMPMPARCGAAAPCRGAATVRRSPHEESTAASAAGKRLSVWSAQSSCNCIDHQTFACLCMRGRGRKLVAIQTEACVCSWGGASACCSEPCGDLLTELLSPGGRKRLTLRMLDKVSETAAGLSA